MAQLLPNGNQQFIDANGNPLVGGLVYFYIPNTTTPKDTWQDAAQTILNTNPVVLDSRGQATIFGSGDYRQILKDSLGNSIWDKTVSSFASTADVQSGVSRYALDTGATNNIVASLSPAPVALTDGMVVRVQVKNTNSGAVLFNLNGLGAYPVISFAGALIGNEMIGLKTYTFVWRQNVTSWHLLDPNPFARWLGTVAQSGGFPTGSIIERGSNANGEYVRFADGTQICTNGFNISTTAANTWASVPLTFPAAYAAGAPIRVSVNLQQAPPSNQLFSTDAVSTSTTALLAYLISGSSASTIGMIYTAIGRWF